MALDEATLRRHIEESFGQMTYPGDDHIIIDETGDYALEHLKGRHWRDISFEILDHLRASLPDLSPEGFRFYLPAYLLLCITDPERADTNLYSVITMLTLPHPSDADRVLSDFDTIQGFDKLFSNEVAEETTLTHEMYQRTLKNIEESYRSGSMERWILERIAGFTRAQSKVILEFLEFMRDEYPDWFSYAEPQTAIERYWHRFSDRSAASGESAGA